MRRFKFLSLWLSMCGLLINASHGITITTIYRSPGQSLGSFGSAGGAPGNSLGAGQLQEIVESAASYWESAFHDDHELTLEYGWFARQGSTASHRFVSGGGSPYRQDAGTIAFDNDGSTSWFLDPTPATAEEFSNFSEITRDFGGGVMTTGLVYTGGQGDASGHDLLSTALHEIGHALGLSSSNLEFQADRSDNDIDVLAPLPFSGAEIPLISDSAHLNISNAVMKSSRPSGVRRLASEADILANAEISTFLQVNLDPFFPGDFTIDFNEDGLVDVVDLDLLLAEGPIHLGVPAIADINDQFDLNGDGTIDPADRDLWLAESALENGFGSPYLIADANLDGSVDVSDFNIWNAGRFSASLAWSSGDFNADGVVDVSDFNEWNSNRFASSDTVLTVPEPTMYWLGWSVTAMVICASRKSRSRMGKRSMK